jgi:imidazolonepropionase-like amidohydrolase
LLAAAGVPVVLSTFDTHNVRNLRYMAGNAVRAGMKHEAAIESVTRSAAAAVGVDGQYGTLETGKVGNVVVWSGDPFEPETAVEHVWIRGEEVPLESRQTKLFERYRTLPRRGEPAEKMPAKAVEGEDKDQNGDEDVESND